MLTLLLIIALHLSLFARVNEINGFKTLRYSALNFVFRRGGLR